MKKKWTDEEVQHLIDNYKVKSDIEIAKELDKTQKSVSRKRSAMRLVKDKPRRKWTESEDRFLKDNYLKHTDEELSKVMNRGIGSIKSRRSKLELDKPITKDRLNNEQSEFIVTNMNHMTIDEISKELNVSIFRISRFLRENKLKKNTVQSYDKYEHYSNEDLINLMWMLYYKLGKVPSKEDFCAKNKVPSHPYFEKRFKLKFS